MRADGGRDELEDGSRVVVEPSYDIRIDDERDPGRGEDALKLFEVRFAVVAKIVDGFGSGSRYLFATRLLTKDVYPLASRRASGYTYSEQRF